MRPDGYMSAWEHSGRLYMLHGDMMIAELIGGHKGLSKYHHGSFEIWRDKIKVKDMAKVERMQKEADDLMSQCNEISAMWINSPAA